MLKHSLAYSVRLLVLFAAGMAFLGWLFVSKLKNLDALEALNDSMGLSRDWNGRAAVLEKRYPWTEVRSASWSLTDLDSFLAVKAQLMPALLEWNQRHAQNPADRAGGSGSSESMMADLLRLRSTLLAALERQRLSLSAYHFFNDLAVTFSRSVGPGKINPGFAAGQRQALLSRQEQLRTIDVSGIEYLGLPH
jgi:hypothetical protein